jgi:hypothetical protein
MGKKKEPGMYPGEVARLTAKVVELEMALDAERLLSKSATDLLQVEREARAKQLSRLHTVAENLFKDVMGFLLEPATPEGEISAPHKLTERRNQFWAKLITRALLLKDETAELPVWMAMALAGAIAVPLLMSFVTAAWGSKP